MDGVDGGLRSVGLERVEDGELVKAGEGKCASAELLDEFPGLLLRFAEVIAGGAFCCSGGDGFEVCSIVRFEKGDDFWFWRIV